MTNYSCLDEGGIRRRKGWPLLSLTRIGLQDPPFLHLLTNQITKFDMCRDYVLKDCVLFIAYTLDYYDSIIFLFMAAHVFMGAQFPMVKHSIYVVISINKNHMVGPY